MAKNAPRIPLPRDWPSYVRTGILHVISLAHVALTAARAVVERFFLSLKDEWLRRILIPLDRDAMQRDLSCYFDWFARQRPHQGLDGRTPQEVYAGAPVVAREKREAKEIPHTELLVRFHEGRKQLPIVELRRVA